MIDLVNRVEALLFSFGKRVSVEELAKICKAEVADVSEACKKVKERYASHEVIHVVEDGNIWKMTIREDYLSVVQNVVTDTELDKQTIETLAVIAFKNPALQADVIKIRTNKAYDHMRKLEDLGYVAREKHGRTMAIKLTPKFFEYFDLPSDKMKEMFNSFVEVEKVIDAKESELGSLRKDVIVREEQERLDRERQRQAEESFDQKISEVEKEFDIEVVPEAMPTELGEAVDAEELRARAAENKAKAKERAAAKRVKVAEVKAVIVEEKSESVDSADLSEDDEDVEDVSGSVSEVQESNEVSDAESDEPK